VVFSIEQENGMVSEVQRIPSGGTSPRHIAFDPSGRWLFAANARSNAVAIFRVDQGKGKLTATGQAIQVTTPVCVTFVP
jgi:6-phosphogluconolactonase